MGKNDGQAQKGQVQPGSKGNQGAPVASVKAQSQPIPVATTQGIATDAPKTGGELGNAAEQPAAAAATSAPAPEPVKEPEEKGPANGQEAVEWMRRELPFPLVDHIDDLLRTNGLAAHAIETKDARTLMRLAGEALVGVREEGANNRGPIVDLIEETIKEELGLPWCMAFVQVCIGYAELKTGVKSPIHASAGVMDVWAKTDKRLRCTADPLPGAVIIWQHQDGKAGHTGILTSFGPVQMTAVEGNTEEGITGGKVERDGGGVYATSRAKAGNTSMRVVGFLKPF